ncbi:SDR family NAD(P)-dependent oxidoreductase [Sphingomonas aestuarii]
MTGSAVVIGASGGIGAALVRALVGRAQYGAVHALTRTGDAAIDGAIAGRIDLTDEASIAAAFERIDGDIDLLLIASGILHDGDRRPERSLRDLDPDWMARNFAVNAIGPALAIKHAAPRLPRDRRSVVAALSARVGSISDNRIGGWYGYRASKAALNMLVRTASIEVARSRPKAVVAALHPGTVDTPLSAPFQRSVGEGKLFDSGFAAGALLTVVDGLDPAGSGRIFAWDGREIQP